MKKISYAGILLLLILILVACSGAEDSSRDEQALSQDTYLTEEPVTELDQETGEVGEEGEKEDIPDFSLVDLEGLPEGQLIAEEAGGEASLSGKIYYSPFTGEPVDDYYLRKALMVIIENSPYSRPQSGLEEASIVYEFLVEGGITRFLALYWDKIPEKIGPVRSARPYFIEIAREYDALLLHAGASPEGFAILAEGQVAHLDQIYNGQYYWRSSDRRAPHNLYTGSKRIERYLDQMIGQEYSERFDFQPVSFIKPTDEKADFIRIPYWGGTYIIYRYNKEENLYYRYYGFMETPHLLDNNKQITANNIIIQYTNTRAVDAEGRLEIELEGSGAALMFKDGVVIEGFWIKDTDSFTHFYNMQSEKLTFNPGQTWIQVVPDTIKVEYQDSSKLVESEEKTGELEEEKQEEITGENTEDNTEENIENIEAETRAEIREENTGEKIDEADSALSENETGLD
ncbi:MAG: DUF3048 domain-containing protein [Halanaerobiales bacterium]